MSSRKADKERLRQERLRTQADEERRQRARALQFRLAGGLAVALAGLGVLFALSRFGESGSETA
jgi:hypothetical protein